MTFKLARIFDGPYRVDAKLSERTFRLVHSVTGELRLARVDNVKPYHPSADLRPQEVPSATLLCLTSGQEQRRLDQVDRSIRSAVRVAPTERLRPTIIRALGDRYRMLPQAPAGRAPLLNPLQPVLPLPQEITAITRDVQASQASQLCWSYSCGAFF